MTVPPLFGLLFLNYFAYCSITPVTFDAHFLVFPTFYDRIVLQR